MMRKEIEPKVAMVVIVRSNSGIDTCLEATSKADASSIVKSQAIPDNHMICVTMDGERTDRWDRQRVMGENRWARTDPGEMEVLGQIREVVRF